MLGTMCAGTVLPSGMSTGPSDMPIDALKKDSNDCCSSFMSTSSPYSSRISSPIPLSIIISLKNSSSTPELMNSSMSKSVRSSSPVLS